MRAYAIIDNTTIYSDIQNITTTADNGSEGDNISILLSDPEITATGVRLGVFVEITNNNLKLTDFGICWLPAQQSDDASTGNKIWSNNESISIGERTDNFVQFFCDLSGEGEINYCAFVRTVDESTKVEGEYYSETRKITIEGNGNDNENYSLIINDITDLGADYAVCTASIQSKTTMSEADFIGATAGFCYCVSSVSQNPTIDNIRIDCTDYAFSHQGQLNARLTGLANNTYHSVRAYLILPTNEIIYSESRLFFTKADSEGDGDPEEGIVISITGTTSTSISLHAALQVNSDPMPTEAGICYSTSPAPTRGDANTTTIDYTSQAQANDGSYDATIQNLTPGTTYYIRGYWIREGQITYSEEKSTTTLVYKE